MRQVQRGSHIQDSVSDDRGSDTKLVRGSDQLAAEPLKQGPRGHETSGKMSPQPSWSLKAQAGVGQSNIVQDEKAFVGRWASPIGAPVN